MAVCAISQAFYGCSNASGTSCTKVAITSYVVNATAPGSCAGVVLIDKTEYQSYQNALISSVAPFDYVQAAAIFGFFFSFVVGTWFVAKNFGLIVEAVRRW